ncbi:L-threonylcarbamoyladenylate synthase [Geobacillus sp. B4113_201601]|uniref:L-threonylcarbamoyladenylate synthase n=1 Tax=Geobacillus sp. B4113_201601 TaxID=1586290 RepID=UPI000782B897|nr:L-threonylcarbamoyladenylate synthase [Geobacillus sp. B4113_201601]
METIKNKILEPTSENFALAAQCVKDGGVIVVPSDCNLGLTVNPWSDDAVERVFAIKNRPFSKPLTLFFSHPDEWKEYAVASDPDIVEELIKAFWPGPLNIILKKNDNVPEKMVCGGETVSLSCAANPVWRGFMEYMQIPVAMTSANISGQADGFLVDLETAVLQVGDKVDYIIKGGANGTTKSSTIIDLTSEPSIVRYGDITVEQLNKVVNIFPEL